MKHHDLTATIIGICIKVHEKLGPGLLESVYEEVICFELNKAGINFCRQQPIPIIYDEVKLNIGFRADIIVEELVMLEIKSIESTAPIHPKILLTYMSLVGVEVGLLINFNVVLLKDGITRLVQDKKYF